MYKLIISLLILAATSGLFAQKPASFKEFKKEYVTYPFSDPNPIPPKGKIYPYFRFDGFTTKPHNKNWKVVQLENEYIRVLIFPEIGGKVWTATDKASGKDFLYNNGVVKFRDIALRGPWVSGGIEANYGIIGHTPNSATPVDYLVRSNLDGSVSCFTSTLDLLTRTRWVLEIKLEKDKAYFTTHSYWFNATGVEKPYYTWMNAAIPASDDLKFLYPGNHFIGHDGVSQNWPVDSLGRNLSFYAQNNFGGSKSYHVLGEHSSYFGGYWENEDFGMIRYGNRDAKLGKKIFLWAQSEEGKIWEDLLTDTSGQYVEIQSGRLFNQNIVKSSDTPFKQIGFKPYGSEVWTEYWYPFKNIDGFTNTNPLATFNVVVSDSLSIKISPLQKIKDTLRVYNRFDKKIASTLVEAEPLKQVSKKIALDTIEQPAYLKIKGYRVDLNGIEQNKALSRPLTNFKSPDSTTAFALYLKGRDLFNFREYLLAEDKIKAALAKDSLYTPALVAMARLKMHRMQNDSAFYYAKKALSIDTYNPEANYYYGLSASKLGNTYDAYDGFEVSSLSPEYRNAAYTALSCLYFKDR